MSNQARPPPLPPLSHLDPKTGHARMVDISNKQTTKRQARAQARMILGAQLIEQITSHQVAKGDVLTVAKIAGIQAAKATSSLIPLAHQVSLVQVDITFKLTVEEIIIDCIASATDRTGVEMEALVGASLAALTIYDMCKAANKAIIISEVRLLAKSGGKSCDFKSAEIFEHKEKSNTKENDNLK